MPAVSRLFGFAVILFALFALLSRLGGLSVGLEVPGQRATDANAQTVSDPQPEASRDLDLRPEDVASWCVSNCGLHTFEAIQEEGRTITHMTTGIAATLRVPSGVSIDSWDCYRHDYFTGPMEWSGCEATYRRYLAHP